MEIYSMNDKDKSEEKKNNKKEMQIDQVNIKAFDPLNKPFKFNIYKKGKRMSRQLEKLKNNFSNFIYHLSLDSPKTYLPNNSKTSIYNNSSKSNLEIKIDSSNTSTTLNPKKKHKTKTVSFNLPKTRNKNASKIKISKSDKRKSLFKSVQFRTTNLNKLYGYNNKFLSFKDNLKNNKDLELEKYQDDILRLSSMNLSRDHLLKLYSDLKTLRINSEEVKPLPPINFRSIINHSLTKGKKIRNRGFLPKNKKFKDMDEYERELYKIKANSKHEKVHSNNKFLYRMYEILPEYLVEKIYAKKNNF